MKLLRNPQEDERLGLSRRSFFFFGAILAAKPEIVVPEPPMSPLLSFLASGATRITVPNSPLYFWHEELHSRKGKLHELHLAPGDVLVLPLRTTDLGRQPVMARVDRFDVAGRRLLTAVGGRGATTKQIDCGEWLVVGQAYKGEAGK